MAQVKKHYVVECKRHGKESKNWAGKQVVVPAPKYNGQGKSQGCPYCRAESDVGGTS